MQVEVAGAGGIGAEAVAGEELWCCGAQLRRGVERALCVVVFRAGEEGRFGFRVPPDGFGG